MKKLKLFSLSLLALPAVGQTILSVLSVQTDLSMLNSFIDSSPTISRLLSTATNFTFLAPSNTAINAWLAAPGTTSLQTDQIEALLSYHLLHGTFPAASFSQIPRFLNSNLNNLTFENITGGQAVELLQSPTGPQILSGNTTVSTISRADLTCTGGIIQIINAVLTIPPGVVPLASSQPDLQFFNQFLNIGQYLSAAQVPNINPILQSTNVTYFVPNTAEAIANFTAVAKSVTQDELGAIFDYHVIPNFIGHSSDLQNGMVLQSVQGSDLLITVQGNETFVNQARVLQVDFLVANGVLHTIDSVLSRFNASPPTGPSPGNFTGFPNLPPHNAPILPSTKAGIAVGVVALVALSFTGLYFLVRCLRRREQVKQANAIREISKPQEYPKIPPKANRILGQDLETGKAATLQSQKRLELELTGVAVAMDERTGRPPVPKRNTARRTFL